MLDSLRRLLRIQEHDSKIALIDRQRSELPGRREAIARAIDQAREAVAAASELLEREELEERRLESDMREQETLEERLNAQSSQVQSTQAYEALRHEIQHASEASSSFETQALELMEAIDEARTRLAEAKERQKELEGLETRQLEEIDLDEAKLSSERADLLEVRSKACEGIEAAILVSYERIAGSREPAVVALTEKSCPACRISVPPQRVREIARGDAVYPCSNCRRLLISALALEGE